MSIKTAMFIRRITGYTTLEPGTSFRANYSERCLEMDNKNNQNNFPGNQKDCPSSQNSKNSQNKNDDKAQQKKNKKEEF